MPSASLAPPITQLHLSHDVVRMTVEGDLDALDITLTVLCEQGSERTDDALSLEPFGLALHEGHEQDAHFTPPS